MFDFTGKIIQNNPFPTYESLKTLYIEYGGDEYCLWHDYGDAYIKACKKYGFTDTEKAKCKNNL